MAVTPPTRTGPSTFCRAVRRLRTVFSAPAESAASVSVACSIRSPATTVGEPGGVPGGPTGWMPASVTGREPLGESFESTANELTPLFLKVTDVISSSCAAGLTMTAGLPDPPA